MAGFVIESPEDIMAQLIETINPERYNGAVKHWRDAPQPQQQQAEEKDGVW